MILIKGNWEIIRDLRDISKIIREYYNHELADRLDELIPVYIDDEYFELEDKLYCKDMEIDELKEEIDELKNKISKLEL